MQSSQTLSFWSRLAQATPVPKDLSPKPQVQSDSIEVENLSSVVVENLNGSCSKIELFNLLERHARAAAGRISSLYFVSSDKSIISFDRAVDAETVVEKVDGMFLRGNRLSIKLCRNEDRQSNFPKRSPQPHTHHHTHHSRTHHRKTHRSTHSRKRDSSVNWSVDGIDEQEVVRRVHALVSSVGPVRFDDPRIAEWTTTNVGGCGLAEASKTQSTVDIKFGLCPLGAFRSEKFPFILVGPYLCLPQQEASATQFCCLNNQPFVFKEAWEPIPPSEIKTDIDFTKYMQALVQHFGPVCEIDPLWQCLKGSLPRNWQRSFEQLVAVVVRNSPQFICIYGCLYLFSNAQHRNLAAAAVLMGRP